MSQSLNLLKSKADEMPNNIEAEQSVIGSILLSNEIFDEVNLVISSKNFYDPIHKKIFEALEKLIFSGLLANPITLKNYFEKEKDELNIQVCSNHLFLFQNNFLTLLDLLKDLHKLIFLMLQIFFYEQDHKNFY